jgi:predicted GNAT superfamily acetyltransferase
MADQAEVRPVETLEEARAAAHLFDRVWGEQRVIGTPLLWAMASHGGQVLAAFRGDVMIGAQVGVVGLVDGKPALHSHITGVLAGVQHRGVGFLLKKAQREWCLARGIDRITWTFDPLVARNAYFNLVKLGAVAERFHRDYYGEMEDVFNRGERSDRLEVVWDLGSERVRAVLGETSRGSGEEPNRVAPAIILGEENGRPHVSEGPWSGEDQGVSISVPPDYHALRERDPELARAWRDAIGDALEEAYGIGYRATSFARGEGTAAYLLETG